MCGGTRAVEEEQGWALAHHLHMPAHARGLDEAACRVVRPVAAIGRPVEIVTHVQAPAFMAALTEAEMREASAWGKGR